MKTSIRVMSLTAGILVCGCSFHGCGPSVSGEPGVPEPIRVLENPKTNERTRFFREVPFKVPKDYDEKKHLAEWVAEKNKAGFTKEVSVADDREQWAEVRRKNRSKNN